MLPSFAPPAPIVDLDSDTFSESLAALFEPFTGTGIGAGYGLTLDVEDGPRHLTTHAFCWCDRSSCPWCSGTLEADGWDGSAHAHLNAFRTWPLTGFVEGTGAPNLWYRNSETGQDVRIWWYKYIGRSMQGCIAGPVQDWSVAIARIQAFLTSHETRIKREQQDERLRALTAQDPAMEALANAAAAAGCTSTLLDLLDAKATLAADLERVHAAVSKGSMVPRTKRDGTPLGAAWRVTTALENAAKGGKGKPRR